jgi:hypothetical protein
MKWMQNNAELELHNCKKERGDGKDNGKQEGKKFV